MISRMRHAGRRFLRDERGGMAVFLAAAIVVLSAAVGLGVDTIRGYLVQSRLAAALDAAGLAGARVMYSDTRDDDILMYFNANFPAGYMGATIDGPNFTVDTNSEVLTIDASATIETSFMRILGFQTLTVSANSEITRQTELLELVLAIDMSGSMDNSAVGGGTRIEAARDAADELVKILFGDDETKALLKIGIVPWNGKVNVSVNGTAYDPLLNDTTAVDPFVNPLPPPAPNGGLAQSVVHTVNNSPVPLLSAAPADWQGCVFARYLNDGLDNDGDLFAGSVTVDGKDWPAWEPVLSVGPEGGEPISPGRCGMAVDNNECTPCTDRGITPLQSNKTDTLTAISQLTDPGGTTDIPQGLAWAWRVLVPEPPFTQAEVDPPGRRTQAIVLLTDGQNYGGSGDGYKTVFGYGTSAQGPVEGPGMNKRLEDVAAAIKAQGILIYTIQFAFSSGSLATLMKKVASGPDAPFYHYAPDKATLKQVFKEVANDLSELRLSK